MNAIAEPPQTVVRMSPHHVETHRLPPVHVTGGLGEMLWGTQMVSALKGCSWGPGLGCHGLDKSKHCLHQGSRAHLLGSRASGNLAQFS
jgi:hypothetical protein